MKSAIITIGAPASGKSTWVSNYIALNSLASPAFVVSNRDDFRDVITDGAYSRPKNPGIDKYNFKQEPLVTALENAVIDSFLKKETTKLYINSNTNLDVNRLDSLIKVFALNNVQVYLKTFTDVELETLLLRNSKRERKVPEFVIRDFYTKSKAIQTFLDQQKDRFKLIND